MKHIWYTLSIVTTCITLLCTESHILIVAGSEDKKFAFGERTDSLNGHLIYALDEQDAFSQTPVFSFSEKQFYKKTFIQKGIVKNLSENDHELILQGNWIYIYPYTHATKPLGALILGTNRSKDVYTFLTKSKM
jgi:hypothetical protein